MADPDAPPLAPMPVSGDGEAPPLSVALVLGSGGARGYAHIGVAQVLREAGVRVAAIAGSSMGALVGGLLAAERLDVFTDWAQGLGQIDVLRMLDVSLSAPAAIRGEKIFSTVAEMLEDTTIEDLPVDFTAVAVDLLAHREVWFREGPLDLAVRASTAIPSLFPPVVLNGRVLVDGGILNPVPVAPVAAVRTDVVVAVDLNGRAAVPSPPVAETAREEPEAVWSDRLKGTAARWFDSDLLGVVRRHLSPEREQSLRSRLAPEGADGLVDGSPPDPKLRSADLVQTSFEIMQGALTRHRLAGFAPDVLVSVPKSSCRTLDFHRADEMITLGRQLAEEALADLLVERA